MLKRPTNSVNKVNERTLFESEWCSFIEKLADAGDGLGVQPFYGVASPDYLGIVARTPSGKYPIVYQSRPVVGLVTCELPAGTVEPGETSEEAAIRELKEETGLEAKTLIPLGTHCSDSGRLTNRIHSFFVETQGEPDPRFVPEVGMRVEYVDEQELVRLASSGGLHQLLHVGTVYLALGPQSLPNP